MSNRAYLASVDKRPCPMEEIRDGQSLCESKYSIPLFWYMLFDRESIVSSQELVDRGEGDNEIVNYPIMSARAEDALRLARSRWPAVERAVGQSWEPAFNLFCAFIHAARGTFIQCETRELWWMMEPDEDGFLAQLHESLSVFDVPLYESVRNPGIPPRLSKAWAGILTESHAIDSNRIKIPGAWAFCGHCCSGEAPWDTNK